MKKFFTQKINISYVIIVVFIMMAGLSQATASYTQPGDVTGINPFIHQGGGQQAMNALRLGVCETLGSTTFACNPLNGIGLDSRGNVGALSWFAAPDLDFSSNFIFATLQNSMFLGRLFVGESASPSLSIWNFNYAVFPNSLIAPLQKVNVHGNTLATNLMTQNIENSDGTTTTLNPNGNARVCVTNQGDLVLCDAIDYFQYQCNSAGQWVQPTYNVVDGTLVGSGIVQGGVLVIDACPTQSSMTSLNPYDSIGLNLYDTNATYTVGNNVCGTTLPDSVNCIVPTIPAFICGQDNPGEWNSIGYPTDINGNGACPYTSYLSTISYDQGATICSNDGTTPLNDTCNAPVIPAYQCQSDGVWAEISYLTPECPFDEYVDFSVSSGIGLNTFYNNGDLVCASGNTPDDNSCVGSAAGLCGPAAGGITSTPPTTNLCSSGDPSIVTSNISSSSLTTSEGSCSGTPNSTFAGEVDWNGNAFDFDPTIIYTTSSPGIGEVLCGVNNPVNAQTCIGSIPQTPNLSPEETTTEFFGWTVIPNASSTNTGSWRIVNALYSQCPENALSCGPLGGLPGSITLQEFTLGNSVGNAYAQPDSCDGTSQLSCNLVPGCTWTNGTPPGPTGTYNWACGGSNGGSPDVCESIHQEEPLVPQCAPFPGLHQTQPATTFLNNGCITGDYVDEPDTANAWQWSCNGNNGGGSISCSATYVNYDWFIGNWGLCITSGQQNIGTQNRTVDCRNNFGQTVSDSFCSGVKSSTTQSCISEGGNNDDGNDTTIDPANPFG